MPRWNWPLARLRTCLALMALVACAPLAALTAWQAVQSAHRQQQRQADDLQVWSRAVAAAVETDLARSAAALQLLVASGWLARQPQMSQVPQVAQQASAQARGGREPLAAAAPLLQPGWQGLFLQRDDGTAPLLVEHVAAVGTSPPGVALSVVAGPGRRLVVLIGTPHWQQLLQRAIAPAAGAAVLLDGQQRVVADTRGPSARVGQPGPADAAGATDSSAAGGSAVAARPGTAALTARQPLPGTGWSVAVSVSADPPGRALLAALAPAAAAALASLLLALALARRGARQLAKPLAHLASAAVTQDGKDQTSDQPISPVREIATLQAALAAAGLRRAGVEHALQQRAQDFEAVFDTCPVAMALCLDPTGQQRRQNRAMQALLAQLPAHAAGPLQRAGQAPTDALLVATARSGQAVPLHEEAWLLQPPLLPRWLLVCADPLPGAGGRPRGAVAVAVDITALKAAQQRLAETHGALQRAQQFIDAAQTATGIGFFHYTVASDTLEGSAGHAQVLRRAGLPVPPASESLQAWSGRFAPAQAAQLRAALHELGALGAQDDGAAGPGTTATAGTPEGAGTAWTAGTAGTAAISSAAAQAGRTVELDSVGTAQRHLTFRMHASGPAGERQPVVIGVVVDTSDQQRAAASRERMFAVEQQARQAAEVASAAKDSLLSMLGHELRNPLNGLTAAAEVLKLVGLRDPLARDARQVIERQAQQLTRLVDDFLDMARLTSGREKLTLVPLDLDALLHEMATSPALRRGLAVGPGSDADAPAWIVGHRDRLLQMLGKLVEHGASRLGEAAGNSSVDRGSNSAGRRSDLDSSGDIDIASDSDIDIASDTDSAVWARIERTATQPNTVALRVGWGRPPPATGAAATSSQSVGKPARQWDRQAERQAERPAESQVGTAAHRQPSWNGGATLGLEWVAALAALHGATLSGDSGSDHGSVVVRFAAIAAPAAAAASHSGKGLADHPRTVLIIEDNRDAALTLRLALEAMGHHIEACGDGRQGLEALSARPPEVAVIDIGLPGISGLVVARQARAAGYAGRLLAVSGLAAEETSSRALKAGFDGYMTKPLSIPRLARWIAGPT